MTWDDIWKVILGVIASVGGIGAIIMAVMKFSSDILAERLSQKYQLSLQKEAERYKSELGNKIYISKIKFDAEFKLYQELSKVFFDMVKDITIMIPPGFAKYPADKAKRKEYEDQCYTRANHSTVKAQDILSANIPFIAEDIYNGYEEILKLCTHQLNVFEERWSVQFFKDMDENISFSKEDYDTSRKIKEEFESINKLIRQYLAKLDVIY